MTRDEAIREYCKEYGFTYWHDALMQPLQRGSRTRVKPNPQMLDPHGYVKKVVVMGVATDVYFDEMYLDHYKAVTGIDFRKQWEDVSTPAIITKSLNANEKKVLVLEMMLEWLESSSIVISATNPRHSLLLKFQQYLGD